MAPRTSWESQLPLSVFSCPHPPPCTRGLLADVGRHSHTLNLNLGVTCFFLASLPYWLPPKSQPFTGKRTPLLPKHRLPQQPPLKKRSTLQASRLGPRLPLLAHNGWEAAGRQATARRPCGGSWGRVWGKQLLKGRRMAKDGLLALQFKPIFSDEREMKRKLKVETKYHKHHIRKTISNRRGGAA